MAGRARRSFPVYHAALAASLPSRCTVPVVFVNIGGISNLTFVGRNGEIVAYDSGPGNTLIDQWVETHAGIPYDQGGMIASEGHVIAEPGGSLSWQSLLFLGSQRRSLDRNDFSPPQTGEADLEDGARTLAHVTAAAILKSARHLPERPGALCRLRRRAAEPRSSCATSRISPQVDGATVIAAEDAGLDGDAMEAEAWAYLAVRSLKGLPLTFPATTGVAAPVTGGVLSMPGKSGFSSQD